MMESHAWLAAVRACFAGVRFEFPGICSYPARQQKRNVVTALPSIRGIDPLKPLLQLIAVGVGQEPFVLEAAHYDSRRNPDGLREVDNRLLAGPVIPGW